MLYFIYIDFPEKNLCRELDFEFEMHIIYITQHNYFCTTFVFTSYFTNAILINFWQQEEYHIKSLPFNFEKKNNEYLLRNSKYTNEFYYYFTCGNIPKLNHFLKKMTCVNFVSESRFKMIQIMPHVSSITLPRWQTALSSQRSDALCVVCSKQTRIHRVTDAVSIDWSQAQRWHDLSHFWTMGTGSSTTSIYFQLVCLEEFQFDLCLIILLFAVTLTTVSTTCTVWSWPKQWKHSTQVTFLTAHPSGEARHDNYSC